MKTIFGTLILFLLAANVQGQNYKAPMIDASGKIFCKSGKLIGSLNQDGVISDSIGIRIAYVDGTGNLIDAKPGKKMGKAEKNGNYLPHYAKTPDERWRIDAPLNGTCLVKDNQGNVRAVVHENYKQFGACAIHCMTYHMNHGEVGDNSKVEGSTYVCSMHPEVTSDKPGKCSKCGAELSKQ